MGSDHLEQDAMAEVSLKIRPAFLALSVEVALPGLVNFTTLWISLLGEQMHGLHTYILEYTSFIIH